MKKIAIAVVLAAFVATPTIAAAAVKKPAAKAVNPDAKVAAPVVKVEKKPAVEEASSNAEDSSTSTETGIYIGINVGRNKMDYSDVSSSIAYELLGGYSISKYVAAEVSYTNLGSAGMTSANYNVTGNALRVVAVGFYPLNEDFSLYGKLGLAQTKMEVADVSFSESKTYLTYGFGAQYNPGNSFGFRLGYDSFKVGATDTRDSNLISLGALYMF